MKSAGFTMKQFLKNNILTAFIAALLLTIVFTFPSVLHLTDKYIGDGGDNYEYASYMGLAAKIAEAGAFSFHPTNYWRYPVGFEFIRGFDSYLTVTVGTVFTLLFGLPFSYNITVFLLLIGSGMFSYLFFYTLSASRKLGIIGMIISGFSFYILAKSASHTNLIFTGGLSLYAYSILLLFRTHTPRLKDFAIFCSAIILTVLGSTEYFVMLILFSIFYLVIAAFVWKEDFFLFLHKVIRNKKILITPLLVTCLILFILYLPHLKALWRGEIEFPDRKDQLAIFTPSLLDYILPNGYLKLWIGSIVKNPSLISIERAVFLGWAEIVLFLLFFTMHYGKRLKLWIFLGFLIPFLLSLGFGNDDHFFLLPYHFLSSVFPFSTIVQPGRFILVAFFFMTIGIVLFLKRLSRKIKTILLACLFVILVIERLPTSYYLSGTFSKYKYIDIVHNENTSAVLDFPIDIFSRSYNMLSLSYDKPIVNGYFHFLGDGKKERSFITADYLLDRYQCSDIDPLLELGMNAGLEDYLNSKMLALLEKNNIRTIVIHKDDKFLHPFCKNVRIRLNRLLPIVTTAAPTEQESNMITQIEDSVPSFSLYFPSDGIFYLDGTYIAPRTKASFSIIQENQTPLFKYRFQENPLNHSLTLMPMYTIKTKVKAGTTIVFKSETQVPYTYFSLWYRYTPDPQSSVKSFSQKLDKIYEDNDVVIYHLN